VDSPDRSAACPSRESRYTIDPAERVRVLLFRDEIPETAELTYSFSGGYERLDYRESENHGSIHYAGTYHPDGMCDGDHICSYCGRVHTYG
jgi:hypothetical protein